MLKAALVSAPVLRVWDPGLPTRLLPDASELAGSAILEQPDGTGAYHPVTFEACKLTPPERLYLPHLLELLAVVHAINHLPPAGLLSPFPVPTRREGSISLDFLELPTAVLLAPISCRCALTS